MTEQPGIVSLPQLVERLADGDRARFERIFHLATAEGETVPPETMYGWIERHFGSVDAVRRQRIVRVTNRWTLEGTLFNGLRARRPVEGPSTGDGLQAIRDSAGDAFCHPLEGTPADVFGRVRGKHVVTASNVAKYDAWHGVIIFDEHDPLQLGAEQVADVLDTAQAWAQAAYREDPEARYPLLIWNCLWRSGASILHGHAQMIVGRGMHFGRVEAWRQAALRYRAAYDADYFGDLVTVMRALGLTVDYGPAACFPTLTPIKEKETHIVCYPTGRVDGDACLDGDLKMAVSYVLRALIERLGTRSFNLALYQPPLGPATTEWADFPFVVRVLDRGPLSSTTSDVGAMELFAQSVVITDPFEVAAALQEE